VAAAPDRVWTAEITYVPTWSGWRYLAVVLDVFSRGVVGWAMAEHLRTELVVDALDMAIWNRQPEPGLVHHGDQGCRYASLAFGRRLRQAGLVASMGSVGDRFDNAVIESVFATWSASCCTATASAPAPRPAWPSSATWRASTTHAGATRRSASSARPTTKGASNPSTLRPSPDPSTEAGQLQIPTAPGLTASAPAHYGPTGRPCQASSKPRRQGEGLDIQGNPSDQPLTRNAPGSAGGVALCGGVVGCGAAMAPDGGGRRTGRFA
jgi:hypothetical protein